MSISNFGDAIYTTSSAGIKWPGPSHSIVQTYVPLKQLGTLSLQGLFSETFKQAIPQTRGEKSGHGQLALLPKPTLLPKGYGIKQGLHSKWRLTQSSIVHSRLFTEEANQRPSSKFAC